MLDLTIKEMEKHLMTLKSKRSVRHFAGKVYYDDGVGPEYHKQNPKHISKKKTTTLPTNKLTYLKSAVIVNNEPLIYLIVTTDIVEEKGYFIGKTNSNQILSLTRNISSAHIFTKQSTTIKTSKDKRYYMLALPKTKWLETEDKEAFFKALYPAKNFPQLFL